VEVATLSVPNRAGITAHQVDLNESGGGAFRGCVAARWVSSPKSARTPTEDLYAVRWPKFLALVLNAVAEALRLDDGDLRRRSTVVGGWHELGVEWSPGGIAWKVDGVACQSASPAHVAPNPWVFEHTFFGLLNAAVGGTSGVIWTRRWPTLRS
jgi:hypothetical protein